MRASLHVLRAIASISFLSLVTAVPVRAQTCPDFFILESLAGTGPGGSTATRIESGWTGLAHDRDIPENFPLFLDTTCPNGTPPCGVCTIDGFRGTAGRCFNDYSIGCNVLEGPDTECGGNTCRFLVLPPIPTSASGVPVCIEDRAVTQASGTIDNETGAVDLAMDVRSTIFLGISQIQPCPLCTGDRVHNDGARDGVCVGGARNGLSCDVNGTDATFGDTSLDCPPNVSSNITGTGMLRNLDLKTGTDTLPFGTTCDAPLQALNCACAVCSGNNQIACNSNAECAAVAAGTCDSNGGAITFRQPNECNDLTCTATGDGAHGICAADFDKYCEGLVRANGNGFLSCGTNADCAAFASECPNNDCGTCSLMQPRPCFLDPIVTSGVADPLHPVLADIICMQETTNSGVNAAAGFPGPERVRYATNLARGCAADDNCPSVTNPDQTNSDCPDPHFSLCNGCAGPVPASLTGCCDGGDACDICPALADNTCNPNNSTSAVVGSAGGTLNTTSVDGIISVTVAIPENALLNDTTISVTEDGPANAPRFVLQKPGAATVLSMSARPEDFVFRKPVVVTMRWPDANHNGYVDDVNGGDTSLLETDLVLKRNGDKFSQNGFQTAADGTNSGQMANDFQCAAHLATAICSLPAEVADCSHPAGRGRSTVACKCDPADGPFDNRVYGEWSFQTCYFSELFTGLTAGDLVPGNGPSTTDCNAEWEVNNPANRPYLDKHGRASFKQTCTDGDAACDRDGRANGSCRFEIGACFNLVDPQLEKNGIPQCAPSTVASWEIVKPRPNDSSRPTEQANARALRDAIASLDAAPTIGGKHGGQVTFSSALTEQDVCSRLVAVEVPLKSIALRTKGSATLKASIRTGAQTKDSDTLKLTCLPASDYPAQ